jgi:chemotaxis protein methyltransferase CheR
VKLRMGDRRLMLEVADAASTNYTTFFREREAFQILEDEIYPTLPQGALRFWSAAASTGEEAFSMAIHAKLVLRSEVAGRIKILATDLSDRHVAAAEKATYADGRLGQLDHRERAFFEPLGMGQSRLRSEIRTMCTFRRMNLLSAPWPFTQPFHLVLLRNVLYYFDVPTRRKLLEDCFDATEFGGWLVTSFTDPTSDVATRWRSVRPGIFRKG